MAFLNATFVETLHYWACIALYISLIMENSNIDDGVNGLDEELASMNLSPPLHAASPIGGRSSVSPKMQKSSVHLKCGNMLMRKLWILNRKM